MKQLTFGFTEACSMLATKTYLSEEDAATLLKFEIHKPKFQQQLGRLPTKDEAKDMMEYLRRDHSMTYLSYQFPISMLSGIVAQASKTFPIVKD